jgi:hypothetical protein
MMAVGCGGLTWESAHHGVWGWQGWCQADGVFGAKVDLFFGHRVDCADFHRHPRRFSGAPSSGKTMEKVFPV